MGTADFLGVRCTKPADDTNASSDHTITNSDPSPVSTNFDPQEEDDEGSSNGTGSTTISSPTPNLMDPTATDHHAGDADQTSDHEYNADQTSKHEHNTFFFYGKIHIQHQPAHNTEQRLCFLFQCT